MKLFRCVIVGAAIGFRCIYAQDSTDSIDMSSGGDQSSVAVLPPGPADLVVMSEVSSRQSPNNGNHSYGWTCYVGIPAVRRVYSHMEYAVSGTVSDFGPNPTFTDIRFGYTADMNSATGEITYSTFSNIPQGLIWGISTGMRSGPVGSDVYDNVIAVAWGAYGGQTIYTALFNGRCTGGYGGEISSSNPYGTLKEAELCPLKFTGQRTGSRKVASRLTFNSGYSLDSIQYQIHLKKPRSAPVTWFEIFKPKYDVAPRQYAFYTWIPGVGAVDSDLYTIDPIDSSHACRFPKDEGTYEVVLADVGIAVDGDRNGTITLATEDDTDTTSKDKPFRFWINDDDDAGDTVGTDIPLATTSSIRNCDDDHVNGVRDLIDFFPVYLDIKQLLNALPATTPGVKYKLKQEDAAVKIVYTGLTREHAFDYITKTLTTGFNASNEISRDYIDAPDRALSWLVDANGSELHSKFIDTIQNHDGGVILVEGCKATTKPLVLSIEKDDAVIAEVKLELSISGVEQMFRHYNLCQAAGETIDIPSRASAPNWPDTLTNGKNFVFLHGYNVNQQQSRAWASEVFKKMWWSGSRARFYSVTWRGADSQLGDALTVNYHVNEEHAFQTAPALANFLTNLSASGEITTCAHSLGNLLVLAALNPPVNAAGQKAFTPATITRHFAFDAALAAEAVDDRLAKRPEMSHSDWDSSLPIPNGDDPKKIPEWLWASEWYTLPFADTDGRKLLTWRGRLSENNGTAIYNFFSSGEEVLNFAATKPTSHFAGMVITLAGYDSARGELAWYAQELLKGRLITENVLGSDYGGWAFGRNYLQLLGDDSVVVVNPTREQVTGFNLTPSTQMTAPLFLFGSQKQIQDQGSTLTEPIANLYGSAGSDFAIQHRHKLLADMIPVRTVPMGREAIDSLNSADETRNFDLSTPAFEDFQSGWIQERNAVKYMMSDGVTPRWLHSDAREVAYRYNHRLFEKWVSLGKLDEK